MNGQFQNGQYQIPGNCSTPANTIPAVAFYHAQPEPTCPAPGVSRIATQTQGRVFRNPEQTCRLELGDIAGNTVVGSLLVLGNDECFTDAELREIFEAPEGIEIIRPEENCRIWMSQWTEGSLTFDIDGSEESVRNAQFAENGRQFLFSVINSNDDCSFRVTRDNRCSPCDNGELIQTFGSLNCSPIVAGPQALFAYEINAGATLSDVTLCVCNYSVPNMVSCLAPASCPPQPPAPPVCPQFAYDVNQQPAFNGQFPVNGNGQAFNVNGNGNGMVARNGNGR